MMARAVMVAMHTGGRIELPPPKCRQNRTGPITFGPEAEPPLCRRRPRSTAPSARSRCTRSCAATAEVSCGSPPTTIFGDKTLVGAQMRYAVRARDGTPLAMLGFSTAAWTLAPRDRFIGWSRRQREKNLPLVVDNPRFLVLPWIRIPNLGSHILAVVRRQRSLTRMAFSSQLLRQACRAGAPPAQRSVRV